MIPHLPSLRRLALRRGRSGSIAPMIAVMLPVLIGGAALAVDAGNEYISTQQLQMASDAGATDAAMLLLSQPTASELQAAAQQGAGDILSAGGFANTHSMTVTVTAATATSVTVAVRAPATNFFSRVLGVGTPSVGVTSTASLQQGSACVLSLSNNTSSLELAGSTTVNLIGCAARSNGAYVMDGGSSMSASAVYAGTTATLGSNADLGSTPVITGAGSVADPFASDAALQDAMLSVANVSGPNEKASGSNATISLTPGQYSSWDFLNNSTVNLAPGTYYVSGDITVNGNATISGSGVTIVSSGVVNFSGGNINLSAPPAGSGSTYPGVLIADASASTQSIQGNSSSTLTGLVYAPNAAIYLAGSAQVGSTSACFEVIGFTVEVTGNSTLSSNCSAYGLINLPASNRMVVLTH